MADEIRSMTNVGVYVTVGPYPVDYLKLKNHFGRAQTLKIMRSGMDEAAKLCEEKRCIAIGEIGRPHFPVDEQTFADTNELLLYGMQKAHDSNVPVVLHTERTTPEQCKELVEMGKKAGLAPDQIVKHFAPPLIHPSENHGLIPSVLASKQNIFEACKKGTRFMMETDYIDDVTRPGAVLSPKTVPRRTKELLNHSILNEKQLYEIHQTLPEKTYGISLEG
jgi:TatD-related deoxyribonuclease